MITSIQTGFLTGNLEPQTPEESEKINWDESIRKYADLCEKALKKAYPKAEITIDWQHAVGVTPASLETLVENDRGHDYNVASDSLAHDAENVECICGEVWQEWKWVVYK